MDISFSAPISGMNAAQLRMDNTAHNVANVNTQGFAPRRVEQVETTRQTQQAQDAFQSSGMGTAAYDAGAGQPDLTEDMTNMIVDRHTYSANAATLKVQDEVKGTVIDLVG